MTQRSSIDHEKRHPVSRLTSLAVIMVREQACFLRLFFFPFLAIAVLLQVMQCGVNVFESRVHA